MLDQRSAHEHDRRQAGRTTRVRPWCRRHRCRSQRSGNSSRERNDACRPAASTMRAIASPRSGCRGTITVSRFGKNPASVCAPRASISSSPGWVEAATTTGRPRVIAISRSSLAWSAGGAGTSSFRLPVVTTLGLPSVENLSASVSDCARQSSNRPSSAEMVPETRRQRGNERGDIRPLISTIGTPPRRARQDQIRPQVGFDEQRQRRTPMIEKPRDIARRVVGDILMDDVGRKPLGDDRRRGHRARGEEDAQVQRPQLLDQRGRGQHLADAGAVNPHQRSDRADIGAHAAALADARRIFLAELQPPVDERRRQRHHRGRQAPVDAQRHRQRQRINQGRPPDVRPPHRRDGSLRSDKSLPVGAAFPWSLRRRPAERKPHQCLPRHLCRMAN